MKRDWKVAQESAGMDWEDVPANLERIFSLPWRVRVRVRGKITGTLTSILSPFGDCVAIEKNAELSF
jgi:hypothetical protein